MPKIGIAKEQLEGLKNPPAGIYEFRLDGFKPKFAKKKEGKDQSTNLRPQLAIINHPTLNDKPIFVQCNTAFGADLFDLTHALGLQYEGEDTSDNPNMPGEFQGPDDDPEQWVYIGPMAGQVGKCEVVETVYNGKPQTQVKKFFCRVAGCTKPHRDSLL